MRGIFRAGHAGVDVYFVLSGFIITLVHHGDIGRPRVCLDYVWTRCTRSLSDVLDCAGGSDADRQRRLGAWRRADGCLDGGHAVPVAAASLAAARRDGPCNTSCCSICRSVPRFSANDLAWSRFVSGRCSRCAACSERIPIYRGRRPVCCGTLSPRLTIFRSCSGLRSPQRSWRIAFHDRARCSPSVSSASRARRRSKIWERLPTLGWLGRHCSEPSQRSRSPAWRPPSGGAR
jgi:hypothetical protein